MKSLETISDEITVLEAERDFGDISPEGLEQLAVLNLCYDLLSRTSAAQQIRVPTPEELKEPGFDDDEINVYGVSSSQLADFAFSIATKQGSVDLKKLLREITWGSKHFEIAEKIKIRRQTIGDYLNSKHSISADNYEKVVNACLTR